MEIQSNQELLVTLLLTCNSVEIEDAMREVGERNLQRLIEVKFFFGIVYEKIMETKRGLKWN